MTTTPKKRAPRFRGLRVSGSDEADRLRRLVWADISPDPLPGIRLTVADWDMPPRMAHALQGDDGYYSVACFRCGIEVHGGPLALRDAKRFASAHNKIHRG